MHGCVANTVSFDKLVLKPHAISIYSADWIFVAFDQFQTDVSQLHGTLLENIIQFEKMHICWKVNRPTWHVIEMQLPREEHQKTQFWRQDQPHDCLLKCLTGASLAFVRGLHRWPVKTPPKGPVTRKMFPSDDVIISLTTPQLCERLYRPWWYSFRNVFVIWMKWDELHNDAIIEVLNNLQNDVSRNIQINTTVMYDNERMQSLATNSWLSLYSLC